MKAVVGIVSLVLIGIYHPSAAGKRCSLPDDLYAFMNVSGQCLQQYQTFVNPVNELSARIQSANKWCSLCAQPVQHWYMDVCVEMEEAEKISHMCAFNGENLCYFVAHEPAIFDAAGLALACDLEFENGTGNPMPQNCSSDCRDALQQAVTSTGCCYESAFNVSETRMIERGLASYRLWESCGLDTSSVDYCSARIGTRNCTESDVFQYLQTLSSGECVSDFVLQLSASPENFDERVVAAERWCMNCAPTVYDWLLNECGDKIQAIEFAHVCGHDGNRNCFHYTRESRFYQAEAETCRLISNQTDYLPFPSTCPSGCAYSLQQLSTDLGCCFESAFNATSTETIRLGLASYHIWDVCGLDAESVGFCTNPFTGGVLPGATPFTVHDISISVILAVLLSIA